MALDIMGREIVDAGAAADFQASLGAYSLTDRSPVDLPNMVAANQKVAALENAGALQAFPFFCYVQDLQRHLCLTAPGEEWIILGGRLHGAVANIRGLVPDQAITELHVSGEGFVKQSVGFSRATDGGILIPETGLYRIRFYAEVDGVVGATPGRRHLSLKVNGNRIPGDAEFEGTKWTKLYDELDLQKGDSVMPMAYQATGQPRDVTGTFGIYQSLTPSW